MSEVLNFRVPDGQGEEIRARAAERGLDLSHYIRSRLDLAEDFEPDPPPKAEGSTGIWTDAHGPHGKTAHGVPITDDLVDKLAERAEAGHDEIEALAKRIYNTEGVPLRVARQRARERLTPSP